MTREEIMAMPAGPELDALVAERFMGWQKGLYSRWMKGTAWAGHLYLPCDDYYCPEPAWSPSTDWAACGPVFEQLAILKGWYCAIEMDEGKLWWETWGHEGGGVWRIVCRAETATLAVCRAAVLSTLEG